MTQITEHDHQNLMAALISSSEFLYWIEPMGNDMATSKVWAGIKNDGPDNAEEKRWRAEDDMRTLMRAKEVEADKERHRLAKKMAADKMKEMAKVAGKDDKK